FVIATFVSVHMGALALMATFLFGTFVLGEDVDTLLSGFPADLFLILVGVTYLFALAKDNGTVDWIVNILVKAVRGRVDRKSTRLNSSHVSISYAVFC